MNKKIIIAGAAALFASIGIYKLVKTPQDSGSSPGDHWTTADMPDLTGKVIIVTGANSGIGFEAAKEFARKGAQTILACRSGEKGQAALLQIQTELPATSIELMPLDLASLASVRQFAEMFQMKYQRLDVLVNNAGIMMVPYGTTEDGFERQLGTNHLGHFALTGLLLDTLLATPGARVINVSSMGHRSGRMDFDNLMYTNGEDYSRQGAYSRSKLANLLFTYELQRRFAAVGVDALAIAAHPGLANTNLANNMSNSWYFKMALPVALRMLQSSAMGALPTIRAAVDPQAQGGEYYGPDGPKERGGYPIVLQSSAASYDVADAQKLWRVSEELTGVIYEPLNKDVLII